MEAAGGWGRVKPGEHTLGIQILLQFIILLEREARESTLVTET